MTVLRGRHLASVGPLESYSITRPAPTEHSGLTTALPATEPGTSQISITVASADQTLPAGLTAMYVGQIQAQVLNNDGTTRNIAYRMLRNGSTVATSTAIVSPSNTQRARLVASFTNAPIGVAVGDTLELRLWSPSSTGGVQLVYWAYYLTDSRVRARSSVVMRNCELTLAATAYPVLSSWPGGFGAQPQPHVFILGDNTTLNFQTTATTTWHMAAMPIGDFYLGQISFGDNTSANVVGAGASSSLVYIPNVVFSTIKLRRQIT